MRSYLTGSFLIAHMKVRYSPNHYLATLDITFRKQLCNDFVTVPTMCHLPWILNLEVNLANEQYLAEQVLSIKLIKPS